MVLFYVDESESTSTLTADSSDSSDLTFTDSIGLGGGVCTSCGRGTPKNFAARFARHHFRYPLLIILDPPLPQ